MRPNDLLSPMDILKEINEQFENSIIVTDVGQHQMLVSQYAEITEGKQMIMSGGLGTMGYGLPGGIGAKIGNPDRPVIVISGDGGVQMNIQELATAVLEELPVILCIFNNEYLGMVRQWQKLFYGKRYAMTNLRAGALSRRTEGMEYPQYTPDFIKLAESYRAKGIRVTKKEEIAAAFEEAKKNTKAPTVIEFIIDPEEMVYPMIKPRRNSRRYDYGLLIRRKIIMDKGMKKRWISLYVENQVGVLSKISGLFSGKSLQSGQSYCRNHRGPHSISNDDRNCQ